MAKLTLENMEFYAFHGHYPEEQAIGGKYLVDLVIETDVSKAGETDDLSDTIDYTELFRTIKSEMEKPAKLLEHLASRILKAIREQIHGSAKVTVRVSKMNPPAGGKMNSFSVELSE